MNIIKNLKSWYLINKRILPWRNKKDPYIIWLSEIFFQQTRINQGLSYYIQFLKKFPTLKSIAISSENEILKSWQGLGYYNRAKNIYHTAKHIYYKKKSNFPNTYLELKKLKGIGTYTACAISSICFNERVPAIDGNAFRVYSRLLGLFLDYQKTASYNIFFDKIQKILPKKNIGDFNQSIMDLGAMICIPKKPKCIICPINTQCYAYQNNKIEQLPIKKKKCQIKNICLNYFVYSSNYYIVLNKRLENSFWKDLYEFSQINFFAKNLKYNFLSIWKINHKLSNKKLNIQFNYYIISDDDLKINCQKYQQTFFLKKDIEKLPLPKPIEKFLQKIKLSL